MSFLFSGTTSKSNDVNPRAQGCSPERDSIVNFDYEAAKTGANRVANACWVFVRQWESGTPPGHDAVMELHRALARSTPELTRPNLELAHLRRLAENLAVLIESMQTNNATTDTSTGALVAYRDEYPAPNEHPFTSPRATIVA